MTVTMVPYYLLALLLLCAVAQAKHKTGAADFWWDLTVDHSALISVVIFPPLTTEIIDKYGEDLESQRSDWDLRFAEGTAMQWLAGGHGFWSAWKWNSTQNQDITGGGFIFNETALRIVAGVSWLLDAQSDAITWNCFVEGNVESSLPWSEWKLMLNGMEIGFEKEDSRWGFTTGEHTVLSKHCATGSPVVGKRYKNVNGREVETSVESDPFKNIHRRKRGIFDKISQTLKNWMEKIKKFFSPGEETDAQTDAEGREDGKRCNTIWDLMVRIIDLILGRNRGGPPGEGPPSMPPPQGGVPQGPNGEIPPTDSDGGDPPGGADVPPEDAEELDPTQNESVRDWE